MTRVLVDHRLARILPARLRRWLSHRAATWLGAMAPERLVDGWTLPLKNTGGVGVARVQTGAELPVAPAAPLSGPASAVVHCVLATSDLDVGGLDEVVGFLARRLRACAIDTTVLHTCRTTDELARPGRIARALGAAGVQVVAVDEVSGRRFLQEHPVDVISAHGAQDWVLEEARARTIPYVDVLHGMHSHFTADARAERARANSISAIVAVSELVRRQYLARVPGYPPARVLTIPNGVELERRQPVDRRVARAALGLRDEFLFVSLARHCMQKNPYGLVGGFASVAAAHPDAHLLIAGRVEDPVYCGQVRRLRDSLPSRHRIHLRDHAANPGLVLSAADCFVLDSFFEGWALASMEALCFGLPIVVSDVGGAREQLGTDGRWGHLISNPLGDPLGVDWQTIRAICYRPQPNQAELEDAMNAVLSTRDAWAARREEIAQAAERRFSLDRCAAAHARLLRQVAARARTADRHDPDDRALAAVAAGA